LGNSFDESILDDLMELTEVRSPEEFYLNQSCENKDRRTNQVTLLELQLFGRGVKGKYELREGQSERLGLIGKETVGLQNIFKIIISDRDTKLTNKLVHRVGKIDLSPNSRFCHANNDLNILAVSLKEQNQLQRQLIKS
jgi:hypothetical protein